MIDRAAHHSTLIVSAVAAWMAVAVTAGVGVGGSWFDEHRILISIVACAAATALVLVNLRTVSRPAAFIGLLWLAPALGLASALLAARPNVALVEWDTLTVAFVIAFAYTAGVVANIGSSIALGVPLGRDTFLVGFSNPRFPAQLQALTLPLLPLALVLLRRD